MKEMICDKPFSAIQLHFDWTIMTEHNFLAPNVTILCSKLRMLSDQFWNNTRISMETELFWDLWHYFRLVSFQRRLIALEY